MRCVLYPALPRLYKSHYIRRKSCILKAFEPLHSEWFHFCIPFSHVHVLVQPLYCKIIFLLLRVCLPYPMYADRYLGVLGRKGARCNGAIGQGLDRLYNMEWTVGRR